MLKKTPALLLAILMFLPVTVFAADYEAGKHYMLIPMPVPARDESKIEVVELFWYGCSHCFRFEPLVKKWKTTIADDVDFRHSPAMWNEVMKTHAKVYFAADALGVLDKVHQAMFDAMNVDRKKMLSESEIATLFIEQGVSKKDFEKAFSSFGVASRAQQADALARGYKITGTPEMVVNGKYRVSASSAGGQADMLKVINFLIAKERQAKASK